MNRTPLHSSRMARCILASAAMCGAASVTASALNIEGDSHSHRFANGEKTVISFAESGSFTVSGSGTIELLAVGGGGGGGAIIENRAGGGGAGGLVHRESFAVSAGTYTVTIGAGGAVGANGGNTVIAGNGATVTAYGGGAGGDGAKENEPDQIGSDGGSGGGTSHGYGNAGIATAAGTAVAGGKAAYAAEGNLGHDGAAATYAWGSGGGGGAGSSPTKRTKGTTDYTYTVYDAPADYTFNDDHWNRYPTWGGDGLAFDITGESVYYAGGGAGTRLDGTHNAQGGLGGGGGYTNGVGSAGTDGLGGGGAGGCAGGSGIVIISFIPSVKATDDFALSGGEAVATTSGGIVHTFTRSGTLTVTGSGMVELLAVGGGGGGGAIVEDRAGGGGAGGLVHIASVPVSAGSYSITVGAGGAIGANGGDTMALGVIAHGGGAGGNGATISDPDQVGSNGGSGGGTSHGYGDAATPAGTPVSGGKAAYGASASPFSGNLGHDGATVTYAWGSGGGGGAGSSPTKRTRGSTHYTYTVDVKPGDYTYSDNDWNRYPTWGGDGLAFDITGTNTYYAGGGAGYRVNCTPQGGKGGGGASRTAGTDGLGGGGGGGAAGGSGVVILRYVPAHATAFASHGGQMAADGEYRVHTFAASGTFTMPRNGLVDILLVGGGGGGGAIVENRAGGGGAGGLVYLTNVVLAAGAHTVTVGAGGDIGENGGNTSISADIAGISKTITAYGGGAGGDGAKENEPDQIGSDGGSGGGTSHGYGNAGIATAAGTAVAGGKAAYAAEGNLGHDGAAATYAWGSGGGGGAGSSPTKRTRHMDAYTYTVDVKPDDYPYPDEDWNRYPTWGGDGLAIDITGESVYYAGGGAAARLDGNNNAHGGLGGGGGYNNKVGSAGTDGLGGGGAGGCAGGSGVVIIRYKYKSSGTVLTIR